MIKKEKSISNWNLFKNGRNCILNYGQTAIQAETMCLYLIDRILAPEATFDARLHLIYLINDVLHNW